MTFALTIAIIETLAVFSSPPVALVSDDMSGFFLACADGVYHYQGDTLVASVGRVGEQPLSGITDIAYSGQFVYACAPLKKVVYQFDRFLTFRGKIEFADIAPAQIEVSGDGALWAYDPDRKILRVVSPFGDVEREYQIPFPADAKFVGLVHWTDFGDCPDLFPEKISPFGDFFEVPVFFGEGTIYIGAEHFEKIDAPGVENLVVSGENFLFAVGDTIKICGDGETVIPAGGSPQNFVSVARGDSLIYYVVEGRCLVRWAAIQ